MRAIVSIENNYLRDRINLMLSELDVHPFPATDVKHAQELLLQGQHRVNAFICDLRDSKDAKAKSEIWRIIRRQILQQGYFMTQRCFVLIDSASAQSASVFGRKDVELIHVDKKGEVHKISGFIDVLATRPILGISHVGASPFQVACVPGEQIAPMTIRRSFHSAPETLDLPRFSRIVLDAVAKYSSKFQQQDNRSLLSLMASDLVYAELLEDRSLTRRNFITSWNLITNEIKLKSERTDIVISKRVRREAYYYIDAEYELNHIETHPGNGVR
jgi:hypothetical protein